VTPSYINLDADAEAGNAIRKQLGAEVEYFSVKVELGPNGIEKVFPIGEVSEYEQTLIKAALPELSQNITNGVSFIAGPKL